MVLEDCRCRGKISYLKLRYIGGKGSSIDIHVDSKQFGPILPITNVAIGQTFELSPPPRRKDLGTLLNMFINQESAFLLGTSCSEDIWISKILNGVLEVVDGESRKGGTLCGLFSQRFVGEACFSFFLT
jgi:hypothetical protein